MTNDPIILALEQQLECYRRLAKLAEIQHQHVQQDQTEALLGVLQDRQAVLEQIAGHERVIGPVKQQWAQYVAKVTPQVRSAAEALVAETRRLLEAITESDKNDALVLQQRKLNLGRQLGHAAAAKQVNRRYAAAAYGAKTSRMDLSR